MNASDGILVVLVVQIFVFAAQISVAISTLACERRKSKEQADKEVRRSFD